MEIDSAKLLIILRAKERGQKLKRDCWSRLKEFLFLAVLVALYWVAGCKTNDFCANTYDPHECHTNME